MRLPTNKLPQGLHFLCSRQFGSSDKWEIEQVLKLLKTTNEVSDKENPITAASLITRSSLIKCLHCKKKHETKNCRVVTELQALKLS